MAFFDPEYALFGIHVHTATFYITIFYVVLAVIRLLKNLINGIRAKQLLQTICNLIFNALSIAVYSLLLYGNIHKIALYYWPFLIIAVVTFILIGAGIVMSCCALLVVCGVSIGGETRLNPQGGNANSSLVNDTERDRSGLMAIATSAFVFGFLIFALIVYAYTVTVVNRDHNWLMKNV